MTGMFRWAALLIGGICVAASWHDERWYAAAWFGMILFFAGTSGARGLIGAAGGLLFGAFVVALSLDWGPRMLANTLNCEDDPLKARIVFGLLVFWEVIPFAMLGLAAAWTTSTDLVARHAAKWPLWAVAGGWVALE